MSKQLRCLRCGLPIIPTKQHRFLHPKCQEKNRALRPSPREEQAVSIPRELREHIHGED